jgi:hypothetical protein
VLFHHFLSVQSFGKSGPEFDVHNLDLVNH